MGQCGQGNSTGPITKPKKVVGLDGVAIQQISAGTSHSLAWTALPRDRSVMSRLWLTVVGERRTDVTIRLTLHNVGQSAGASLETGSGVFLLMQADPRASVLFGFRDKLKERLSMYSQSDFVIV